MKTSEGKSKVQKLQAKKEHQDESLHTVQPVLKLTHTCLREIKKLFSAVS